MKPKTIYFIFSAILLLSLQGEARLKKVFKIGGRDISVTLDKLTPPIEINATTSSKNPVIAVYLSYNRLLASGKIKEASLLTQSPQLTEKQQNAYLQRLGSDELFRKKMSEVLNSRLVLNHIVEIENSKMLLGSHPEDGLFANFFVCSNEKCVLTDVLERGSLKDLGLIFSQLQEGSLKIE